MGDYRKYFIFKEKNHLGSKNIVTNNGSSGYYNLGSIKVYEDFIEVDYDYSGYKLTIYPDSYEIDNSDIFYENYLAEELTLQLVEELRKLFFVDFKNYNIDKYVYLEKISINKNVNDVHHPNNVSMIIMEDIPENEIIEKIYSTEPSKGQSYFGNSESWYDFQYTIKATFGRELLETMTKEELYHLLLLSHQITSYLY